MQINTLPEIEQAELEAARRFLTSVREEERRESGSRIPLALQGGVAIRNGIPRARLRSSPKTDV